MLQGRAGLVTTCATDKCVRCLTESSHHLFQVHTDIDKREVRLTENWHVTNRRYVRRSEAWQWFWMNLYMHICFFVVFMNHFGKHYLIGFRLRLEVDSCSTCYHRECHSIGFNWESGVSGRLPFRLLRDALGRDKLYFTRWEWECSGN